MAHYFDGKLYMTKAELESIPEYSLTLPTGTTIGKIWRKDNNVTWGGRIAPESEWFLGQYWKGTRGPSKVGIVWTPIVLEESQADTH